MKHTITILGSTGSIGLTTINIVKRNQNNFNIVLLSTNNNVDKIFKQAKSFNVKNVIVTNRTKFLKWKNKFKKNNINLFNNFDCFDKIFKKKINYTINAISGLEGLYPTINIIKHTKKIAIANKESIICGWNLINKELEKYKTEFIPVDSEHFSIFKLIDGIPKNKIKEIIITASGGPFLKKKINNKIKISDALKHPNWKMGKKITIDSSTLMNKVFEVIEAKKIFNISIKKIKILINPNSYIHAIIIFKNGIIKILAHETKMDIPIFNSIYGDYSNLTYNTKKLNLDKINNLNFTEPNLKKFNNLNILKLIPIKDSLFETALITINDEIVNKFLLKKIKYNEISIYINKIINFKIFKKYCKIKPKSIGQIFEVRDLAIKYVNGYIKK